MQVTTEMFQAARDALGRSHPTTDLEIYSMLQAALEAMPLAAGGLMGEPGRLVPQLADVTPPQKVHGAADKLPGLTFNLDQQYGGLDEAALKKPRLDVRGNRAGLDDEQQDGDGHAGY
jgi:hypothetical protein